MLLTIAEVVRAGGDLGSRLSIVSEHHAITRLGEGVDEQRQLGASAVSRTLACLSSYAEMAGKAGVSRFRCVGTSALRDARGSSAFGSSVAEILGAPLEIISGAREAKLTFWGATSILPPTARADGATSTGASTHGAAPTDDGTASADGTTSANDAASAEDAGRTGSPSRADTLVGAFDIGGGSTELVLGTATGHVHEFASVDVGSVRLFERHPGARREEITAAIRRALPPRWPGLDERPVVLGIAGTMTTLWALAQHPSAPPHGDHTAASLGSTPVPSETTASGPADFVERPGAPATLQRSDVEHWTSALWAMTLDERKRLPGLAEGRVDVIPHGALLARELFAWFDVASVLVTARGVRHGLLLEALET